MSFVFSTLLALGALTGYVLCKLFIVPKLNPLQKIAGPPCKGFTGNLSRVLEYAPCSLKYNESLNVTVFKVLRTQPRFTTYM